MHNPHMIVALGVYITVLFVAQAIGMGVSMRDIKTNKDVVARRTMAAAIGAGVAFAFTVAYAITMRQAAKTATYWASLSIVFFGMWYAVYMVVPKVYDDSNPQAKTEAMKTTTLSSHGIALGLALLAYGVAWKVMKPLQG